MHLDGGPPVPGDPKDRGLVAVNTRIVTWENGAPVVKDVPMFTPAQVVDIGAAAVAQPYSEPGDELAIELGLPPSEFYGRPLLEVMKIKQAREAARTGDASLVGAIEDRLVGKPKQTSESKNLNINGTYEDFLRGVAQKEAAGKGRASPPVVETSAEDLDL